MFSERSKHSNVLTIFFSIMQTLEKNITGTLHFFILPTLWERYLWMFSERFETSIVTLKKKHTFDKCSSEALQKINYRIL